MDLWHSFRTFFPLLCLLAVVVSSLALRWPGHGGVLCPWNSVEQPEIYVSNSASFCRCLAFSSVQQRPITCRRACAGFAHLHGGSRDVLGRMRKWTVSIGVRRDELSSELVQSLNGRLRACARIWPSDLGADTQHSVKRESIHAWSECDGNREIYYYAHSTRRGGWTYKLSFHGCDQHGRDSRGVRSSATGTFSTARGASGRQ